MSEDQHGPSMLRLRSRGPAGPRRVRRRGRSGGEAGEGDRQVQEVVLGVDRKQPEEHVVARCEAPDRHHEVDGAEAERKCAGAGGCARQGQPDRARCDVDEVVPAVDLEDDQLITLDVGAEVAEARVDEEAEDPGKEQRRPEDSE